MTIDVGNMAKLSSNKNLFFSNFDGNTCEVFIKKIIIKIVPQRKVNRTTYVYKKYSRTKKFPLFGKQLKLYIYFNLRVKN